MPKNEALDTKRHSLAHLMAACIQEMFPEARFGVGPVIEDGFYYDVSLGRTLTPDDLHRDREEDAAEGESGTALRSLGNADRRGHRHVRKHASGLQSGVAPRSQDPRNNGGCRTR